jgi:hypothetical protein
MVEHVARMGENFCGRSEDNITMGMREIDCEDRRWMELAADRVQWRALVLAVLNPRALLSRC